MKFLRVLKVIDKISEYSGKAVCFLILGAILIMGYEVVARYVFNRPTLWVHELSTMFFGTFVIVGGAQTLLNGGHVKMDVIYSRFSPRVKAIIDLITFPVFLAFVLVLVIKGGQAAWRSVSMLEHASSQWAPPFYPFRLMLPLGALLVMLQGLAGFVRNLLTAIKGEGPWT
jgi:TRAP-type mannitol/chloroaromatic compound transport system permease small subunit